MKKLLFFIVITSLSSCVGISKFAYHAIDTNLNNSDYESLVRRTVTGEASATYVFGIGGMSKDAQQLYDSSYQDMVLHANLGRGQMIVNIIAESKLRNWFGVVVQHTVYTTGTVVDIKDQKSQNFSQTSISNTAKKHQVGDKILHNGTEAIVVKIKSNGTPLQLITAEEAYVSWGDEFNKSHATVGATNPHKGKNNTNVITKIYNWKNRYPAFAWCAELGKNWHIPSKNEMEEIAASGVLGKLEEPYLTSTEVDAENCYAILNGALSVSKYTRANVRAICYLE